ncbi:MAG: hypothetical protein ABIP49_00465 [Lysobacterales bacterium]
MPQITAAARASLFHTDRRKAARRTALLMGAVAVAVYVGFLMLASAGGQ